MNHETDIQPKQTKTSEKIRIPSSHENCRGPQGDPQKTQSGTQRTCRLKPSDRLKKSFEFQSVIRHGHRLVGKYICIDRKKGDSLRFGITASKKYGNSPERNRFKRLVREAFRTSRHLLPSNAEINIFPRQLAKKAMMGDLQNELIFLLKK
jgi:ribonuclease P protein component